MKSGVHESLVHEIFVIGNLLMTGQAHYGINLKQWNDEYE